MAQRRMFSPDIVCSEEFLEMPPSTRELYFQLGMGADDDGFIQPKGTIRKIGAKPDDLNVLIAKRFVLPFESGVIVVKHWLIHNMIRADRYKPTRFQEEKSTLHLKDNKSYTDNPANGVPLLATKWQPNGNQMAPQVRLGKVRLGKIGETNVSHTESKKEETSFVDVDDDGQPIVSQRRSTAPQNTDKLLSLLEKKRGSRFPNRPKQIAAIKRMYSAGISLRIMGLRWDEMRQDSYWQNEERIPDMCSVENNFSTKPPTIEEVEKQSIE